MVTVRSQIVGFAVLLVAAVLVPAVVNGRDVGLSVIAGVSGGTGVLALYAGLATGKMGVVAPITAALSGSLPAAYDMLRGTSVSSVGVAGMFVALIAIVVVSVSGHQQDESGSAGRAVSFALLAGIGFAGGLIAYEGTAHDSGFWPLAIGRATSVAVLGAIALVWLRSLRLDPDASKPAVLAGVFDSLANIAVISAMRLGPLAIASVLTALYPVATVLLARYVLEERLHVWQQIGVVLALVAVVLTALA